MKLNPVKPRPRRSHSWLTACLAEPVIAWLRLGIWIDADAHVEDAADLAWPSADRFCSGVDPALHGEPGGDSERARPEGPQPYRDRAVGLGFHVEVADAVVAPALGVAGVCPGSVDGLNGFCEAVEGSVSAEEGLLAGQEDVHSDDHDRAAPGEDGGHAAVDLGAHHVTAAERGAAPAAPGRTGCRRTARPG
jgi:hypothetical protein